MEINNKKYSGKTVLRMPPSLHKTLDKLSESEGVSLNLFIVSSLARSTGHEKIIHGLVRRKRIKI